MCIFCDIVQKKAPATILYEDDLVVAFENIEPKTPIHLLVVPKKHIDSINGSKEEDKEVIGKMVLVARDLAGVKGISESGYRLILNNGRDAGQTVDHLHLHLIGGEKLPFA
jgi:histidine triad (HIT) family protein